MCGIVAQFAYGPEAPPVSREEILAIRDAMANRGPDGAGYWESADRRVALGHRRLSIIDLTDAASQPFASAGGDLHVVFNGEIYNFRELRRALEAKGQLFRTSSDTEVLAALWRERGERMVDALRGMYAFAIWDGREKTLFAARDPLGIKPLYVADDGQTLRLASQVRALLAGGGVDTTADPAGHVGFFVWGSVPEPFTLYRGVSALPAGGTLKVRPGWAPEIRGRDAVRKAFVSHSAAAGPLPLAELREALAGSVAAHLVSDVPVGLFLSSGRDSTTIGALALELGWAPRTVTVAFDELRGTHEDETSAAEAMARQMQSRHATIPSGRREFEEALDPLFAAMDQPSIDGVNTWLVARAARREGWKVALSGLGGDELFGGYPSFREVPRSATLLGTFARHPEAGRLIRRAVARPLGRVVSPKYASVLEYGGSLSGAYFLRRALHMPWELTSFLEEGFVASGWERLATLERLDESIRGIASPHAAVAALEMSWYMRNQLLRDADWAGMSHSLEIRVPLVDAALLGALAPAIGGPEAPTKELLSKVLKRALPREILERGKVGFVTPIRSWLAQAGDPKGGERGVRGWARKVMRRVAVPGSVPLLPSGEFRHRPRRLAMGRA